MSKKSDPSPRRFIFCSIRDERTKTRFKGHVYDLRRKGDQRILTVYGNSWEEMRDLKHYLEDAVRKYYSNKERRAEDE